MACSMQRGHESRPAIGPYPKKSVESMLSRRNPPHVCFRDVCLYKWMHECVDLGIKSKLCHRTQLPPGPAVALRAAVVRCGPHSPCMKIGRTHVDSRWHLVGHKNGQFIKAWELNIAFVPECMYTRPRP